MRNFCFLLGVAFGQGVYFARDASCSVNYARGGGGARHMYLSRVLVGAYCQGDPSMKAPPPKHSSVVDKPANPTIFVVFHDNQCYPAYLITFQ